ncbi:MAG: histidine phosphatase family protein [Desulfobacterales bacterium]|nr:histidine phosphatase family protein [Desulfobacterales bacterium]MCP4162030.1 histidine phosphatase family protein [Deltaproteobacteria bacterium]
MNIMVNVIDRYDLIERDFGIIGGINQIEAQERMDKKGFTWINIPESEKPEEIDSRIKRFLIFLGENHTDSTVLVSTHADVVKSFHRLLNGITVENSMIIEVKNSEPHYFSL